MTERTHYVELGINETATEAEIRTAYRRLVLLYHPDRSGDSSTTERFVKISEAYRTLSDQRARQDYDSGLKYRRDMAEQARNKPPTYEHQRAQPKDSDRVRQVGDEAAKLNQAAGLFASGKYDQAESIIRLVLRTLPNSALGYAILGDISRQKGDIRQALTNYSYAVQFAPNNASFQRRYEELLEQSSKVSKHGYVEARNPKATPLVIATLLIGLMAILISVSTEGPIFPRLDLVSSYSFTFILLSFLAGIAAGSAASIGGFVDRLKSLMVGASGKASPFAILGLLGIFSFWLAALIYFSAGLAKDAFTYSASRIIALVAAIALIFSLCGWMADIYLLQALLWSGNIVWLGALSGWAIADGFR